MRGACQTTAELKALFEAALSVGTSDLKPPEERADLIEDYARFLKERLSPGRQGELEKATQAYLEEEASGSVGAWMRGVEHTACRAGLMIAADARIARQAVLK